LFSAEKRQLCRQVTLALMLGLGAQKRIFKHLYLQKERESKGKRQKGAHFHICQPHNDVLTAFF
jgi:hypothetical protein